MDLERIKQNFRIRSGRSKRTKKAYPVASSNTSQQTSNTQNTQPKEVERKEEPAVNGGTIIPSQHRPQAEEVSSTSQADTSSRVENVEDGPSSSQNTQPAQPLTHRPSLPHASTGIVSAKKQREEAGHNGNSGAEDESLRPNLPRSMTDPYISTGTPDTETDDFDLKPPAPKARPPSVERLSELLFSAGHLNSLLHQPGQLERFTGFLLKFRPNDHPLLAQYLETQKAIKAIEYANAIAAGLKPVKVNNKSADETTRAATIDKYFQEISQAPFNALVGTALPLYVTFNLIKVVSEQLTNEITGRSTPMMRDLVGGLSEVFCLTDPNQEDNPIIYASEEFYRLTGYGQDDVINHNCRFLQGPKTNRSSPHRLKEAIQSGEEICETLLNYRRDGRPFINLLMIAPLHDNRGKIKYHIGAQIDVTGLVEKGRALESFQKYLDRMNLEHRQQSSRRGRQDLDANEKRKRQALEKLRDLSEMFDIEESAIVQAHSRSNSTTRDDDDTRSIGSSTRIKGPRRRYVDAGDSDAEGEEEDTQEGAESWKLGSAGDGRLSGKLPGVYDSFMLIRPSPSFRIVFVSHQLRRLGDVVQKPFMSHIAAPAGVMRGLHDSFEVGVPVTAKVHFMPQRGESRDGTKLKGGIRHEDGKHGRACWISCTPMLGSDDRIGVWMVVFVEKSRTRKLPRAKKARTEERNSKPKLTEGYEKTPERSTKTGQSTGEDRVQSPLDQRKRGRPDHIDMPQRNGLDLQRSSEASPDLARADLPIKPIRLDSTTQIRKASPPTNEPNEQPQQSQITQSNDQHKSDHPLAAESPVEEYQEPRPQKSYHVEIPSINTDSSPSSGVRSPGSEGFVTTRSPQLTANDANDRVVIEDTSADEGHDKENVAPKMIRELRPNDSSSPSPVWSPAAESPMHSDDEQPFSSPPRHHRRFSDDDRFASRKPTSSPPLSPSGYKHKESSQSPHGAEMLSDDEDEDFGEDFDERKPANEDEHSPSSTTQQSDLPENIADSLETSTETLTSVNTRPTTSGSAKNFPARYDYLSHPGSKRMSSGLWPSVDEQSGSRRGSSATGSECVRSPYSVD